MILPKPDSPEISLPREAMAEPEQMDAQRPKDTSLQSMRKIQSTVGLNNRKLPADVERRVLQIYNDFISNTDDLIFTLVDSEKLGRQNLVDYEKYSDHIVKKLFAEENRHSSFFGLNPKGGIYREKIQKFTHKAFRYKLITSMLAEIHIGIKKQSDIESIEKLSRLEVLNDFAERHAGKGLIEFMSHLFPEWISPQEREQFVQQLGQSARRSWTSKVVSERSGVATTQAVSVPEIAPAIWKESKEPGDTPPEFIKRHYGPWLNADATGLTRPDIKRLDPSLYMALANWLRKNELPDDCPVPIKSQRLDSELARVAEGGLASVVSGDDPATILRDAQRLLSAKRRRAR